MSPTPPGRVELAERARNNLLVDARVSVSVGSSITVRFWTRAHRSDFPMLQDTEQSLFDRARMLAEPGRALGFVEVGTEIVGMADPLCPDRMFDTWYQVRFESHASALDDAFPLARWAIAAEKVVFR